jgi:hypothetical protein
MPTCQLSRAGGLEQLDAACHTPRITVDVP